MPAGEKNKGAFGTNTGVAEKSPANPKTAVGNIDPYANQSPAKTSTDLNAKYPLRGQNVP